MNPNDPAFPVATELGPEVNYSNEGSSREIRSSMGMSLRAHFAGQALQMPFVTEILENELDWKTRKGQVAAFAVEMSDAVITELNKESESTKPEL